MHEGPTWELLDAYLAGTASPEQREVVRRWLAEVTGRQAALESLRSAAGADSTQWNVDAAWTRVAASIASEAPATGVVKPLQRRAPTHHRAWRIAAVLVVTAGAGIVGREVVRSRAASSSTASSTREIVTGPGQRLALTLDDGSHVTLNAGSRLRYDTAGDGPRNVTLDGEAYFDVRHDERRPFRVRTRGGIAEDVGTRFVVRAYPEQTMVSVAVEEGAVRVHRVDDSTRSGLVTAGMLGTIPSRGPVTVAALSATDHYFAWTRGLLSLDGQAFHDVIPMLEHWYGVTIQVPDSALAAKQVFGTFQHESLQDALAALALALDARYSQTGQSVTFTPRVK